MKAIIYARCSTDENKQDVEVQLGKLRQYCQAAGWEFDEVSEYASAYRQLPQKLSEIVEKIRRKEYQIIIVYTLDRFSRLTPTKTVSIIHQIVEESGCRFISLNEGIDSAFPLWQIVMMIFSYTANVFSAMLSVKVKEGIARAKEKGTYRGGRKPKKVDTKLLWEIKKAHPVAGFRILAALYNKRQPTSEKKLSYVFIRNILRG